MSTDKRALTTSWGAPVGDNQNSQTSGQRGPVLLQDVHLMEKSAHFNRERVLAETAAAKPAPLEVSGTADSVPYSKEDHYTQPGGLYRLETMEEQDRLVATFTGGLSAVTHEHIQLRMIDHLYKVDADLGTRVAEGLGLTVPVLAETL